MWLVLPLQRFSLHQFLRSAHGCRCRPVPIEIVRTLTYQMLLGIQHSHQHSIVHDNLTPQHMLLDDVMRLKLTDFSHSVMTTTTQRPRSLTATDLSVRAPEVLLGESHPSVHIDMWAARTHRKNPMSFTSQKGKYCTKHRAASCEQSFDMNPNETCQRNRRQAELTAVETLQNSKVSML
jgi:serine/threonine protein kinase